MQLTLEEQEVLVLDGQTTGASPKHGRLLELAWARPGRPPSVFLLEQPSREPLSRRTTAITGIADADMADAVPVSQAWAALRADAAALPTRGLVPSRGLAPCVVHYARFEAAFLRALHQEQDDGEPFPLELICTHEIALRIFPGLPRRGLRALAGYLGHVLGEMRRAAPHVLATRQVWDELVVLLREEHGVHTLPDLRSWLEEVEPARGPGRDFAIEPEKRLSLPDLPGVYRFVGKRGQLLYVGKATSLRRRVNSYFQKRRHQTRATLEMLTQAHDVLVQVEGTPLEAALREADLIKAQAPPYNVALRNHPEGRAPGDGLIAQLERLITIRGQAAEAVAAPAVSAPALADILGFPAEAAKEEEILRQGFAAFATKYGSSPVGGLGARLWRQHLTELERRRAQAAEAQREPSEEKSEERAEPASGWRLEDPQQVLRAMEFVVREGTRVTRLRRWLRRLTSAVLVWQPRQRAAAGRRLLALEDGRVAEARDLSAGECVEQALLAVAGRPASLDVTTHDRLRVLTTELRRLVAESEADEQPTLELWLAPGCCLRRESLRKRLLWV